MRSRSEISLKQIIIVIFVLAMPLAAVAQEARLVSSLILRASADRFGGWSGLHVFDEGKQFLALSDRGSFVSGVLNRDGRGNIVRAKLGAIEPVRQINGKNTKGRTADSEGLAVDARGRIYVSFEVFHRIRRHKDTRARAENIPAHPAFKGLQKNSSLEALAIDGTGALYAMPERSGDLSRPFPIYRYKNGRWVTLKSGIPRRPPHLLVGADFGPDGRLYILERDFQSLSFSTRVRSFKMSNAGVLDERTHILTRQNQHENLEGISVWKDALGKTRITMITDNNFRSFLPTRLVEYVIE